MTRLTYSALHEDLVEFPVKPNTQELRTPHGPRMGFRESFLLSALCAAAGKGFAVGSFGIGPANQIAIRQALLPPEPSAEG